ncbi:MAG: 3-dehydroquinate synthase [Sphingomonadales bacterium]|jgi:3-dehydroquinate synthase
MSEDKCVEVSLGARSYDIHIGEGLIARAGELLRPHLTKRTVIVTDEQVADLHLARLQQALAPLEINLSSIVLPAGEATKSFAHLEKLCDRLLEAGVERRDCIIALGGGVIGDLTGFAASILRRGMDFIQIPTTLLAQVDSSVGGKTGINSKLGKNLIGAFHQPKCVLADVSVLETLSPRDLRAGYAEVVKYGLIDQPEFFTWLEDNGEALLAGDMARRIKAVEESCKAKARIVAADERESGQRALLNLGHTFGHALEAEAQYDGRLLHGEAVSIGMAMAYYTSARLGLCPTDDVTRILNHLKKTDLPIHPKDRGLGDISAATMAAHMRQDKKVSDGQLTLVLAKGLGQAFLTKDVNEDDLLSIMSDYLAQD